MMDWKTLSKIERLWTPWKSRWRKTRRRARAQLCPPSRCRRGISRATTGGRSQLRPQGRAHRHRHRRPGPGGRRTSRDRRPRGAPGPEKAALGPTSKRGSRGDRSHSVRRADNGLSGERLTTGTHTAPLADPSPPPLGDSTSREAAAAREWADGTDGHRTSRRPPPRPGRAQRRARSEV